MGPVGHVPSNCGDHGGQDPLRLFSSGMVVGLIHAGSGRPFNPAAVAWEPVE